MKKVSKKPPNPYKSSRSILDPSSPPASQSLLQPQCPNYFQSFIYTDYITNNKLSLEQFSPNNSNSQMSSIFGGSNDCIGLLRETKKFHIQAIKGRYYRVREAGGGGREQREGDCEKRRKYIIRRKNQREKYHHDKKQLSSLLSRDLHYLYKSANISPTQSPSSLQPQPQPQPQPQQSPSTRLLEQLQNSIAKQRQERQLKIVTHPPGARGGPGIEQPATKSERELMGKFNKQLRREIVKNSQYLIAPDLDKLRRRIKMGDGGKENRGQLCHRKTQLNANSDISCLKFKMEQPQQAAHSPSPHPHRRHPTPEQQSLLSSIQSGNFFKTEIELFLNPNLLHIREPGTNNNILHLCIASNQVQIFKMVVQRCRERGLDLFRECNRYKRTPLEMARFYRGFYEQCRGMPEFQGYYY